MLLGLGRSAGRRAAALAASSPLLGVAVLGCDGTEVLGRTPPSSCDLASASAGARGRQVEIKVATFWTDSAESLAFNVLADGVDAESYVVVRTARRDRVEQVRSLRNWLPDDGGPLPDVFQVNGGSDVLQFVDESSDRPSELCPLDELDERYGYRERFLDAALRPSLCRDVVYALPVGVHRLNLLFFNPELLDRLVEEGAASGIELRRTEELASAGDFAEELAGIAELGPVGDTGAPLVPLAIDGQNAWPLTIFAFENLMLAAGGDLYETTWRGGGAGRAEELGASYSALLGQIEEMARFSNLDRRMDWRELLPAVAAGEAAYTVMGDWALAQLTDEQRARVSSVPFPGTSDAFVYTPDSFAIPRRGGSNGEGAHHWLSHVIDDVQTQIRFAEVKHSIPTLRDVAVEDLPTERMRDTYREFSACAAEEGACRLLLAVSGLGPPPGLDPCFDDLGPLLLRAVGAAIPAGADAPERGCPEPFPEDARGAGQRAVELLLQASERNSTADCE